MPARTEVFINSDKYKAILLDDLNVMFNRRDAAVAHTRGDASESGDFSHITEVNLLAL